MNRLFRCVFNKYLVTIVFFVATVFYCYAPIMPYVDLFINVLLAWIAGAMIYDFFVTHQPFSRDNVWGLAFTIWVVICSVVGGLTATGIKICIYVLIQTVFFVNVFRKQDLTRTFDLLATIIGLLGFVVNALSLILYFSRFYKVFANDVITDTSLILGRHPNGSLYGLLCNSNWMSFFALLVGAFSLYQIRRNYHRIFYILNALLALDVIVCSNSRGTLVGLFSFALFFLLLRHFNVHSLNFKTVCHLLLQILITVGCLFIAIFLLKQCRILTFKVIPESGSSHQSTITERDDSEKTGSTATRLALWETGLNVALDFPVFGVGYDHIQENIWENRVSKVIDTKTLASNTHNVYVQTLVGTGFVGLLLLLACITFPMLKGILIIWNKKIVDERLLLSMALVLSFCVINLVEADIVVSRNFMSTIFWTLLGYVKVSSLRYNKSEAIAK